MAEPNRIARSVFGRFMPAASVPYLVVLTGAAVKMPGGVDWHPLVPMAVQLAALTLGFGCTLVAARTRVASAPRLGLRAAAAGFLAPLGLGALSVFTQGATLTAMGVFGVAAGAGVAALLALSTLRRTTPARLEDPELKQVIAQLDAELANPQCRMPALSGPGARPTLEGVPALRRNAGEVLTGGRGGEDSTGSLRSQAAGP